MKSSLLPLLVASTGIFGFAAFPHTTSAQLLETETARIPARGHFEVGTGYEFQTASAGTEHAIPVAIELGLTSKWALLVEPVPYTSIRPKTGPRATGIGDLEVTATYVSIQETSRRPALALAFEAKIPTAKNSLIGTTKPDYAGYLIASRRSGRFDSHANIGYTIVGQPSGVTLSNIINGALATELRFRQTLLIYGEILGSTAATSDGESGSDPGSAIAPEAAGGTLVGTLGVAHVVRSGILLSLSFSYDNSQATLIRPGITIRF